MLRNIALNLLTATMPWAGPGQRTRVFFELVRSCDQHGICATVDNGIGVAAICDRQKPVCQDRNGHRAACVGPAPKSEVSDCCVWVGRMKSAGATRHLQASQLRSVPEKRLVAS